MFPQDWEQAQAGGVLAAGPHAFDSDPDISDVDEDDRETLFSSMDVLSPGGHSDAQTLAMMLQEQLDAINEEIRYDHGQNPPLPCAEMAPGGQQIVRGLCWPKIGALICPGHPATGIGPSCQVSLSLSCTIAGSEDHYFKQSYFISSMDIKRNQGVSQLWFLWILMDLVAWETGDRGTGPRRISPG